jgi:hypothetical protein
MANLWHISEDDSIQRFEPRSRAAHDSIEPFVWAIDEAHVPAYWFPRECPRGTYWAVADTSDEDVGRLLLGDRTLRVHLLQADWLGAVRSARLIAYRLPSVTFEPYGRAAGYWVSREPVVPLDVVEVGDLLDKHAEAGVELRIVPRLRPVWQQVIGSTVEFSGIRLRNLEPQNS